MTENFRWGVIGPGRIAQQFTRDVQVVEGSEIYAVASRSGAEMFVREFHNFHFENARLCLAAGKPVLCEKPLTVNAQQAEILIDLSRNNKVFLMEALWSRYLPIFKTVRKLLDEQTIGEVQAMQSSFGILGSRDEKDRWLNPNLAGGTLLDLGIYPIAVSQWAMQANPVSVQSQAVLSSTGVDILLAVNLQYPSGTISQFTSSFVHKAKNQFVIYGSKGNITLQEPFWGATEAILEVNGEETVLSEPFRSHGFEYEIEEAVQCIREGRLESSSMTHADSLANMELMDTIREQVGVKYPFE
jgi:predicted dehydrogenase